MTRRSREEIYLSIAIGGFFMPVLQLVDSSIMYALTGASKLVTTSTVALAPASTIPSLASLGSSIALIFLVIAILGVVQDFESGLKMKYKALIFNIGSIIGLCVFWNPLSNIKIPIPLGSDAIFSSIISIIIVFVGMGLAVYLERRNSY